MRGWLARILVAVLPLLATVLFASLTMEGVLGFGGGEKDVWLALPLLLFSLVFLVASLIAWWRRMALARAAFVCALVSAGAVAIAWSALFALILIRGGAD